MGKEIAVVTGAAGGIGSAIVHRLLKDGWHVHATDVDRKALDRLADEAGKGAALSTAVLDVSRKADCVAVAAAIAGGRVTGLVNAAGLLQDVVDFLDMDEEFHRRIWAVNYDGAVFCTQAFAPLMIKAGKGSIVNITSLNEHRPLPLHAYATTKVALGTLTQLTAGELGVHGIRVNAVAPGFTLTPIFKEKIRTGARKADVMEKHTAMGKLIEPDEVAAVVSFLMGEDARAVTGVSIPVDRGWLTTAHWMNFRELKR